MAPRVVSPVAAGSAAIDRRRFLTGPTDRAARFTRSGVMTVTPSKRPSSSARSHSTLMRRGSPRERSATTRVASGAERHGVHAAGDGQAMLDVRVDLVGAERRQRHAARDAIVQREHRLGLERLQQRRLSAQHDLHEPPVVLLERGEQANLIEHLRRQRLRFVEDDDRVAVDGDERSQEGLDRVEELRHVGVGERTAAKVLGRDESEVAQHDAEDLGARTCTG